MARYKRRSDGRYQKQITIINNNGIEVKKYIYATTIDDLEAKAQIMIEESKKGIFQNADLTVGQYAVNWLDQLENKCSGNTYQSYKYSVKHIIDTIGAIKIKRLTKNNIQKGVDSFSDKPRTAQIYRMTINRICESAIDDQIIARNPCRGVLLPRYKAKEKRALTEAEIKAIQSADFNNEERLFVSLLYYCGLRRGEALALSRKDIDLDRGILTVNHSLAFDGNNGVLKEPKTKTSCRTIPIPAELKQIIKESDYEMFLFTRDGRFFTHSTYVKMWNRVIKKMNEAAGGGVFERFEGLTAHIFRHNYATLLYRQGVDVKTAQGLLGHSTIAVTMDIYTHLSELDQTTISKIENAFAACSA